MSKCAGCGLEYPCSDSKRKDISGYERAKHVAIQMGKIELCGSVCILYNSETGKTLDVISLGSDVTLGKLVDEINDWGRKNGYTFPQVRKNGRIYLGY